MSDDRVRRNIEAVKTLLDQCIREAETDLETSAGNDGKLPWLDRTLQKSISAPTTQAMRLIIERMLRRNKRTSGGLQLFERHVITKGIACKPAGSLDEAIMKEAFEGLLNERVIKRTSKYHGVDGYVPVTPGSSREWGLNLDDFIEFYRRIGGVGFSYHHPDDGAVVSIFTNSSVGDQLTTVLSSLAHRFDANLDVRSTANPGEITFALRDGTHEELVSALKSMRQALKPGVMRQRIEKAWAITHQDLSTLWDHQFSEQRAAMSCVKSVSAARAADGLRSPALAPAGAFKG